MKKLFKFLLIIVLLVGFGFACFYIFKDEKEFKSKIKELTSEYVILIDNQKLDVSKDTLFMVLGELVDYKKITDYSLFDAILTVRESLVTKVNFVNDDNKVKLKAIFYKGSKEENRKSIMETVKVVNHVLNVEYVEDDNDYLLIELDGNINQIIRYLYNLDEIKDIVF